VHLSSKTPEKGAGTLVATAKKGCAQQYFAGMAVLPSCASRLFSTPHQRNPVLRAATVVYGAHSVA
jgi:hypothetical protein